MIWAQRMDLLLTVDLYDDDEIHIVLTAREAALDPSDARRLAAALLNAADQIEELATA